MKCEFHKEIQLPALHFGFMIWIYNAIFHSTALINQKLQN